MFSMKFLKFLRTIQKAPAHEFMRQSYLKQCVMICFELVVDILPNGKKLFLHF